MATTVPTTDTTNVAAAAIADEPGTIDQSAVSVHHLRTVFLPQVESQEGLSRYSTIYDIENLRGPPGVIRQKGSNVLCPKDGKKGAAYVHCLSGIDNVGLANFMLSYTWSYTIGDIVDTLVDFCNAHGFDPKRTYIWICCLCVNQHRVAEMEQSGMLIATEDFFVEFGKRVTGIGHVLSMMTPWNDPSNLKRVWCIFEQYMANEMGCAVTILMPPDQKAVLARDLFGDDGNLDALYQVLAKTKVQDAQASVEKDRVAILDMVKRQPGYAVLNSRLNELLRGWVRREVSDIVYLREQETATTKGQALLSHAYFCNRVGCLLSRNGEHEAALDMLRKACDMKEDLLGNKHPDTATSYNNIGSVLKAKGDYKGAIAEYQKALEIRKSVYGEKHPSIALTYNNIGVVLHAIGDSTGAMAQYRSAAGIQEELFGNECIGNATTYSNIASILQAQGDYDGALFECRKALTIREASFGKNHPSTADSYNSIGLLLKKKGDYKAALVQYRKAVAIRESLLGKQHRDTANSYNNLGSILRAMGDFDGALKEYRKALAIRIVVFGQHHPSSATLYNNIGSVLIAKGDKDGALQEFENVLHIRKAIFGNHHPSLSTTYNNIGVILDSKGDVEGALEHYEKALAICESTYGKQSPPSATFYSNIAAVLKAKGDYDGSLQQYEIALSVRKSVFGNDHPIIMETHQCIDEITLYLGQKAQLG